MNVLDVFAKKIIQVERNRDLLIAVPFKLVIVRDILPGTDYFHACFSALVYVVGYSVP